MLHFYLDTSATAVGGMAKRADAAMVRARRVAVTMGLSIVVCSVPR